MYIYTISLRLKSSNNLCVLVTSEVIQVAAAKAAPPRDGATWTNLCLESCEAQTKRQPFLPSCRPSDLISLLALALICSATLKECNYSLVIVVCSAAEACAAFCRLCFSFSQRMEFLQRCHCIRQLLRLNLIFFLKIIRRLQVWLGSLSHHEKKKKLFWGESANENRTMLGKLRDETQRLFRDKCTEKRVLKVGPD